MPVSPTKLKQYLILQRNPALAGILSVEVIRKEANQIAHRMIGELIEEMKTNPEKFFPTMIGPQGEKGEPGDSIEGQEGPIGLSGFSGIAGKDGKPGKRGERGFQGEQGSMGKDGKDGKDGVDGSPDTNEQVREKLQSLTGFERLDASAIKNLERHYRDREKGVRRMPVSSWSWNRYSDLSGQVNGNTRTFTVPVSQAGSETLWSTQAPIIFRPTLDFTVSATTLTIDSSIPAIQRGQSLVYFYAP